MGIFSKIATGAKALLKGEGEQVAKAAVKTEAKGVAEQEISKVAEAEAKPTLENVAEQESVEATEPVKEPRKRRTNEEIAADAEAYTERETIANQEMREAREKIEAEYAGKAQEEKAKILMESSQDIAKEQASIAQLSMKDTLTQNDRALLSKNSHEIVNKITDNPKLQKKMLLGEGLGMEDLQEAFMAAGKTEAESKLLTNTLKEVESQLKNSDNFMSKATGWWFSNIVDSGRVVMNNLGESVVFNVARLSGDIVGGVAKAAYATVEATAKMSIRKNNGIGYNLAMHELNNITHSLKAFGGSLRTAMKNTAKLMRGEKADFLAALTETHKGTRPVTDFASTGGGIAASLYNGAIGALYSPLKAMRIVDLLMKEWSMVYNAQRQLHGEISRIGMEQMAKVMASGDLKALSEIRSKYVDSEYTKDLMKQLITNNPETVSAAMNALENDGLLAVAKGLGEPKILNAFLKGVNEEGLRAVGLFVPESAKGIVNSLNQMPALKMIMPFMTPTISTISTAWRVVADLTPLGLAGKVLGAGGEAVMKRQLPLAPMVKAMTTIMRGGAEGAAAMANVVKASALMYSVWSMVNNERVMGAFPSDIHHAKALRDAGFREYSIRVGDKWIPYHRTMGAFAPIIDFMTHLTRAVQKRTNDITPDEMENVHGFIGGITAYLGQEIGSGNIAVDTGESLYKAAAASAADGAFSKLGEVLNGFADGNPMNAAAFGVNLVSGALPSTIMDINKWAFGDEYKPIDFSKAARYEKLFENGEEDGTEKGIKRAILNRVGVSEKVTYEDSNGDDVETGYYIRNQLGEPVKQDFSLTDLLVPPTWKDALEAGLEDDNGNPKDAVIAELALQRVNMPFRNNIGNINLNLAGMQAAQNEYAQITDSQGLTVREKLEEFIDSPLYESLPGFSEDPGEDYGTLNNHMNKQAALLDIMKDYYKTAVFRVAKNNPEFLIDKEALLQDKADSDNYSQIFKQHHNDTE